MYVINVERKYIMKQVIKILIVLIVLAYSQGCATVDWENLDWEKISEISKVNKKEAEEKNDWKDDVPPPKKIKDWVIGGDIAIKGRGHQVTVTCDLIDKVKNLQGDSVNGNMWIRYGDRDWVTWDYTRQGVHLRHFPWALDASHDDYKKAKKENWPQVPHGGPFDVMWSGLIRDKRRNVEIRSRTVHYDK